jgi:hypothetical protein
MFELTITPERKCFDLDVAERFELFSTKSESRSNDVHFVPSD